MRITGHLEETGNSYTLDLGEATNPYQGNLFAVFRTGYLTEAGTVTEHNPGGSARALIVKYANTGPQGAAAISLLDREYVTYRVLGRTPPSPYLARLYGRGERHILLEHLDGAPIQPQSSSLHSEEMQRRLLQRLFLALSTIHDAEVAHRDIRPSHVLVDKYNDGLWLIDFTRALLRSVPMEPGLPTSEPHETYVGTNPWLAPELASGPGGYASDVYAAACVAAYAITGSVPPDLSVDPVAPSLRALLHQCLVANPRERPQSQDAVRELAQTSPPTTRHYASTKRPSQGDRFVFTPMLVRRELEVIVEDLVLVSATGDTPGDTEHSTAEPVQRPNRTVSLLVAALCLAAFTVVAVCLLVVRAR